MEKEETYQHDWRFGLMMRYWTVFVLAPLIEELTKEVAGPEDEFAEERAAIEPFIRRMHVLFTRSNDIGRLLEPDTFNLFCELHDGMLAAQEPFATSWLARNFSSL